MKKLITLLIFLSLASCNKDAKANKDNEIDTLQLTKDNDLLFLEVTINDKKANLLLDTGANLSALDSSNSKKYGYSVEEDMLSSIAGIGGTASGIIVTDAKVLYDGKLKIEPEFKALKLKNIHHKIDGILGSDYLIKNSATVDYKNSLLILKD